ncbi:MAG: hypothetical protein S4CHLAM102_10530 [Chlamydiia bacterium]|nr:hypothetical protein [Chlamydiia bacterium]
MTRISKQAERRHKSPRKRHARYFEQTGPKKCNLPKGFREHTNNLPEGSGFFPTVKGAK